MSLLNNLRKNPPYKLYDSMFTSSSNPSLYSTQLNRPIYDSTSRRSYFNDTFLRCNCHLDDEEDYYNDDEYVNICVFKF